MKKLLPKTRNSQGFSLIELLVVVTIIAILSAIGITAFGSISANARDAKRKADVDAIAKAYEKNYDFFKGVYRAVATSDFTSREIPTPPEGNSYDYTLANDKKSFTVCARLEGNPANTACTATSISTTCYCQSSALEAPVAGGAAACSTVFPKTCKHPSLSGTYYIDCPATALNCSGTSSIVGSFPIYTQATGGTALSAGTPISIYGVDYSGNSVTLQQHSY